MIAIIPARGGSKGVPHKNIKNMCGKPLIYYTIDAAIKATSVDRVIVTTDDPEIANIAKEYGAEIPFMRPTELAGDYSKAQKVYLHAVEYLHVHDGENVEKFMVLLPTVPFRTAEHIDEAVQIFNRENPTTLVSVKKEETPPSWLYKRNDRGYIVNAGFDVDLASGNRQENPEYYVPNGAIYILDYNLLKNKMTYFSEDTIGYVMDDYSSLDIDSMEQFQYAEYLMHKRLRQI